MILSNVDERPVKNNNNLSICDDILKYILKIKNIFIMHITYFYALFDSKYIL